MEEEVKEVEFLGYLFNDFQGKKAPPCGIFNHPQFYHLDHPPDNYQFVQKPGGYWKFAKIMESPAMSEIKWRAKNLGADAALSEKFLIDKAIKSTKINPNAKYGFMPSTPLCVAPIPWVIEIEDCVTLFKPYLTNGKEHDFRKSPYFPIIQAMLESTYCRAIVTHVKSTSIALGKLFGDIVADKVHYFPMGVVLPNIQPKSTDRLNLIFTNSWHQSKQGFSVRGGKQLIQSFFRLADRYKNLHLIIRSVMPYDTNHPRIHKIPFVLTRSAMDGLMNSCHIFMIPSARLHVMSVLQAYAYGLPVVASDGWGFNEYVTGKTGCTVNGMWGLCSWTDKDQCLQEDYKPLLTPNYDLPDIVDRLTDTLIELINNPVMLEDLSAQARHAAETEFSINKWNDNLKRVFDLAFVDENEYDNRTTRY